MSCHLEKVTVKDGPALAIKAHVSPASDSPVESALSLGPGLIRHQLEQVTKTGPVGCRSCGQEHQS